MDSILLPEDFEPERAALAHLEAAGMLSRDIQFEYFRESDMPLTGRPEWQRDGTITWHSRCPRCHEPSRVAKLDPFAVNAWQNQGKFVQDAFPHLTKAQRETLISGYHDECFDLDWYNPVS
jgi:hypothetical protein